MAVRLAVKNLDGLPGDALRSIKFAAEVLDRSERSIYRDIQAGRLSDIKIGGSRRVKIGDLRSMAAGRCPDDDLHPTVSLAQAHAESQGHQCNPVWVEAYSAVFNPDIGRAWDENALERFVIMFTELAQQANMVRADGQRVCFAPTLLDAAMPTIEELRLKLGGNHD
jgi:hypothetical protein